MTTVKTPENSNLWEPWTDPVSGITSYLLTQTVAPMQQTFYYVNDGWTRDGRYLWFYCAYPPSDRKCLAVVDFLEDRVSVFPESQFLDASPCVDPASGDVYWISDLGLYRRSPAEDGNVEKVNSFPVDLAKGRRPRRIATHLTFSADGLFLNFDAELGRQWFAGAFPLDGGDIQVWKTFDVCYNHAQFSPTDPDLMLIAQDGWSDPETGQSRDYTHRMWLLSRSGQCEPIYTEPTPRHGHEWWDFSGEKVWYINYGVGVECVDLATRRKQLLWQGDISHAHANTDGSMLTGDHFRKDGSGLLEVRFYDIETSREIPIVSAMPDLCQQPKLYHLHPHPRFTIHDSYISYMSTVRNRVDVAVTPIAPLMDVEVPND